MNFRIGSGYDVHRLVKGRELWIGGVRIPHEYGLLGHSDADVLLHALCDALLGAAGLGDIGIHFPDTDPQYKNIDSKILLNITSEKIFTEGYVIGNIDCTIVAQKPKLMPFVKLMKEAIAGIVKLPEQDINIKATTTENLGFVGREEGIAAYASVLIYKKS